MQHNDCPCSSLYSNLNRRHLVTPLLGGQGSTSSLGTPPHTFSLGVRNLGCLHCLSLLQSTVPGAKSSNSKRSSFLRSDPCTACLGMPGGPDRILKICVIRDKASVRRAWIESGVAGRIRRHRLHELRYLAIDFQTAGGDLLKLTGIA